MKKNLAGPKCTAKINNSSKSSNALDLNQIIWMLSLDLNVLFGKYVLFISALESKK